MAQAERPTCPKCRSPMQSMLIKGTRKFRCVDCEGEDPMKSPDVNKLFEGELRPPE